jgi:hypothetical protein
LRSWNAVASKATRERDLNVISTRAWGSHIAVGAACRYVSLVAALRISIGKGRTTNRRCTSLPLAILVTGTISTACERGEERSERMSLVDDDVSVSQRTFEEEFADPPVSSRPWIRWWWPGGAVDDEVITAELARIEALGFGGVEVQPFTKGISETELAEEPAIRTVGTPEQLAHVRSAVTAARALQLGFALTLGSGWPTGGAFSRDLRPRELLRTQTSTVGPTSLTLKLPEPEEPSWVAANNSIVPDSVGPFDPESQLVAVLAAPLLDEVAAPPVIGHAIDVSQHVSEGVLSWNAPVGNHAILAFYSHAVSQRLVAPAFPGDDRKSFVIDHLDPNAIRTWMDEQARPMLNGLRDLIPDEIFIDSFELMAQLPWTEGLAEKFRADKGYDLTPYLPFLFLQGGETKFYDLVRSGQGMPAYVTQPDLDDMRAREDYEDVRAALFASSFVSPTAELVGRYGSKFRLQAHGGWGVQLDDYALADIPEAEGMYAGGSTEFLSLASSAAHVAGRTIASMEAFVSMTLMNMPPLGQEDLWRLAGRAFGAGIGRLVYHGMPYPRMQGENHWYPFGPRITQNFSTSEMMEMLPSFNKAIARISWAISQGTDRAEIVWLLPERHIQDQLSIRGEAIVPREHEGELSIALRRAGFVYDRISPSMLTRARASDGVLKVGAASYKALLLADWEAAEPRAIEAALEAASAGIPVVVVGALPARARGRSDLAARDRAVVSASDALRPLAQIVATPVEVTSAFANVGLTPAASPTESDCDVVTVRHRESPEAHVFFVFNEGLDACNVSLTFGIPARSVRALDPESGVGVSLAVADSRVSFALAASRARVVTVSKH